MSIATDRPSRERARPSGGATRFLWRRRRAFGAAAIVVTGVTVLVSLALAQRHPDDLLEPSSPGPNGGRAIAQVLRGHGVDVDVVRSIEAATAAARRATGPTTLVLANPAYLGDRAARELVAGPAGRLQRLVLAGVTGSQLDAMGLPALGLSFAGSADSTGPAACPSGIARRGDRLAGPAVSRYALVSPDPPPGVACFPVTSRDKAGREVPGGSLLLALPASEAVGEVVLFGAPEVWANSAVAEASNAAVALRALGHNPHLIWYQPGVADLAAPGSDEDAAPWPSWAEPAAGLVLAAFVLFAVAQGRRLGRLVPEPLPVVVPAAETTLSRGRLYRRAPDRLGTAAVLRRGTAARLRVRLGMPHASLAEIGAAAAPLAGLPPHLVDALLAGPAPTGDAALVQLAHDLTELEDKVRRHE